MPKKSRRASNRKAGESEILNLESQIDWLTRKAVDLGEFATALRLLPRPELRMRLVRCAAILAAAAGPLETRRTSPELHGKHLLLRPRWPRAEETTPLQARANQALASEAALAWALPEVVSRPLLPWAARSWGQEEEE
jgi:hypothetical protein